MPVSCPAEDFKDRGDNLLENRHLPVLNEGKQTPRTLCYTCAQILALYTYVYKQTEGYKSIPKLGIYCVTAAAKKAQNSLNKNAKLLKQ